LGIIIMISPGLMVIGPWPAIIAPELIELAARAGAAAAANVATARAIAILVRIEVPLSLAHYCACLD
jgi:hypothetical protein